MPTKNIEPTLRLISEYTKLGAENRFCIPEYQRAYSWTIIQCDKLWQDIETFINSGAEDPYFLGTVIIDCSTDNCLSLIDGQQRTTTFLLLLKALQLSIKDSLRDMKKDEDSRPLQKSLNRSYETILEILYKADEDKQVEIEDDWDTARNTVILENKSINELYKSDFQIIIDSETFDEAEQKVYKMPRRQKDNKYTNFFRNFKFFYDRLQDYAESKLSNFSKIFLSKCQVIEIKSWQIEQAITMFNSLNSTGMPLSDADIISAQLFSKATDKNEFVTRWKHINEMADALNTKKIINIDSVLQQFMYIDRAKNAYYKLNEVTTPGLRKYYTIEHPELFNDPKKLCDAYEKILSIWNKIIDYPIIKLLLRFNDNFKLFLVPYLYRYEVEDITEEKITPVVEAFLRLFTILEISQIGFSSSALRTYLFNANFNLVDPEYPVENLVRDFDAHIRKCWTKKDIAANLLDYDKNVLVYLNEYLYAKREGLTFNFETNVNVEHIMPASGHNSEIIRQDAGIKDPKEFEILVNKLGNKILLEENINKSIGRDWFETKKSQTVQSKQGYINSSFGQAQALARYSKNKWEKEDIEHHTQEAVERIVAFIFNE